MVIYFLMVNQIKKLARVASTSAMGTRDHLPVRDDIWPCARS